MYQFNDNSMLQKARRFSMLHLSLFGFCNGYCLTIKKVLLDFFSFSWCVWIFYIVVLFPDQMKTYLQIKKNVKMYCKHSDIRLEDAAWYISLCFALAWLSVLTIPFYFGSKFCFLNMLGSYSYYVTLPPLILFSNMSG